MKLKRVTALTLSVLMLFSLVFATSASATILSSNGIDYQRISGTNTVEVVGITIGGEQDSNPTVTIPYSLSGYPVVSIGASAFINNENQKEIILPDGLLKISTSAFYDASSLTNITIPSKVSQIDISAFGYCTSLKSVTFKGTSIDTLDKYAFYSCTKLDNVVLPQNLKIIDEYAFANCTSLTKIYIPSTTFSIADNAFNNSNNVTIYGEYGSSVHTYAVEKGIPFVSLSNRDYTDIINLINAVGYLNESKYTTESYSAVKTAYDTAVEVKNDFFSTQAQIDTAANELGVAFKSLKLIAMLDLEATVAEAKQLLENSDIYTDFSVSQLSDTITSAEGIIQKTNPTSTEVENMTALLKNKINSLQLQSNADLQALVNNANQIINSSSDIYTVDSILELTTAIANANAVLESADSTDESFKSEIETLTSKINALHLISYDTLADSVNNIQQEINTNGYKYTDDSIKAVQDEIDIANALLSNPDATNDELVAQNDKLTQAYNSLVTATSGDVNSDGTINVTDVLLILKNVIGSIEFNAKQQYVADLDSDGIISVIDAVMLQRIILEINEF